MVKEAIACGLPVVSRDVGDVRQRLANVRPSHVTGPSAGELGEALAEVLARCERSNGPEVAREFSIETMTKEIVEVYARAVATRRKIAATERWTR